MQVPPNMIPPVRRRTRFVKTTRFASLACIAAMVVLIIRIMGPMTGGFEGNVTLLIISFFVIGAAVIAATVIMKIRCSNRGYTAFDLLHPIGLMGMTAVLIVMNILLVG